MSKNKLFTIALAIVIAFSFTLIVSDESSADVEMTDYKISGFTDVDAGNFTVYLDNTSSYPVKVDVIIKDADTGNIKAEKNDVEIPGQTDDYAVTLSFSYGTQGTYYVNIELWYPGDATPFDDSQKGIAIDVVHSIWKDSATYVAIVIVIIVIAVIAYLYMRGAPGRAAAKSDANVKTFTELENERRMKKSSSSPTKVEKYESSDKRTRRK